MTNRWNRSLGRIAGLILLGFLALFYLQFGVQALLQFPPQGVAALIGSAGIGWGALRVFRRSTASRIVFWTTVPLLGLHAVMTLIDAGELPFLIGSIPVPALAGGVWVIKRLRRPPVPDPA